MGKKKELQLRRSLVRAMLSLLIAIFAVSVSTFAWYIYNTTSHTTKVHMAAGSGMNLEISNAYAGPYAFSTVLEQFVGKLSPVSTDQIVVASGTSFQKVQDWEDDAVTGKSLAKYFQTAEYTDYYKTSLFLRASSNSVDVYVADIGYEDSDTSNPISTAIRLGLVTHEPGENQPVDKEYIFAINEADNPQANYNTFYGTETDVLDHTKTDGSVVDFSSRLLTPSNFCNYDSATGAMSVLSTSKLICNLPLPTGSAYTKVVQVDIYIWLEGCDKDCTSNIAGQTLRNISISFAGDPVV